MGDLSAIKRVGKIRAYNIHKMFFFLLLSSFLVTMLLAFNSCTVYPTFYVTLCYMWKAQKLLNALGFFFLGQKVIERRISGQNFKSIYQVVFYQLNFYVVVVFADNKHDI